MTWSNLVYIPTFTWWVIATGKKIPTAVWWRMTSKSCAVEVKVWIPGENMFCGLRKWHLCLPFNNTGGKQVRQEAQAPWSDSSFLSPRWIFVVVRLNISGDLCQFQCSSGRSLQRLCAQLDRNSPPTLSKKCHPGVLAQKKRDTPGLWSECPAAPVRLCRPWWWYYTQLRGELCSGFWLFSRSKKLSECTLKGGGRALETVSTEG